MPPTAPPASVALTESVLPLAPPPPVPPGAFGLQVTTDGSQLYVG